MRLANVTSGHSALRKIMFKAIRLIMGREPYDVVKMLTYRPEHLGDPLNHLSQAVLRGPSDWTVGERELFAAFVSSVNQCPF